MASLSEIQALVQQIKDDLPALVNRNKVTSTQIVVGEGLSDISKRLGLIQAGEFRVGNSKEPGFGFTGVRIGYPAFVYANDTWHVAGVNVDVLQFGLRASDGKGYFAAGKAVIGSDGMILEAQNNQSYFILWKTNDNQTTVGKIGAFYVGTDSGIEVVGVRKTSSFTAVAHLMTTDTNGSTFLAGVEVRSTGEVQIDLRTGTVDTSGNQKVRVMTNVNDTNGINTVLYLESNSKGTAAAGFGTAIGFWAENSSGSLIDMGYVGYAWTTATAGSESSRAVFGIKDGGSAVEGLQVTKTGVKTPIGLSVTGGFFNIPVTSTLTIATGVVTATASHHLVETQGLAATDDLDTINGGVEGDLLIIHTVNNARDVTAKDGTGNLNLAGDFLMDTTADRLLLMKQSSNWVELARSNNA